jgi:murein DD-endopeptidase MepM/ murein hydrolase activator NlpD
MPKPSLHQPLRPLIRGYALACLGCVLLASACGKRSIASAPAKAAEAIATAPSVQATDAGHAHDAAPLEAATVLHTIGEGETLWDIARAYGVSIKQIMAQNGFQPSDMRRLRTGVQLKLSGVTRLSAVQTKNDRAAQQRALPELTDGAYHFLRRGESLWTLARLYDVPIESIMNRNGFSEDIHGQLRVGQPIVIPGIKPNQVKQPDREPIEPTRHDGFVHEITRGETVWDIAHTFGVSVAEIMAANGLNPEAIQSIREGQQLFLPGVEDDGRGHVRRAKTAREGRALVVARQLSLGTLQAAGLLLHGRVAPRWIAAAGGGTLLAGTLRWPVTQGWFVRGFGSGQGGYHKAMDIMGKIGWNVRAAADGIVGYAGDKVPGFGNMIMVVHAGGWVTLYAHNSVNFVAAGERVQKGAVLAEVGSTGRSTGPHVHFELIYDGKNCDPAPLFRPGVRHRSGKFSSVEYTSWRVPAKRPKAVQCATRQKHPISVLNENPILDAQKVDDRDTRDAPAPDDLGELIDDLLR